IGIDGGTTRIKAVLFDAAGHEIDKIVVENEQIKNGVRVELDMKKFWEKTAACVKHLMKVGPAEPDDILAVGVTGQGEGLWTLSKEKEPIYNAILWNDGRAQKEAKAVNEKTPGIGKLIHRNLGTPVDAGSTLLLLKWMKANRADIYRQIRTIFFAKDWLRFCMTDELSTDYTDGGPSYLKIADGLPAQQVLTILDLKEVIDWIPPVKEAGSVSGFLTIEAAEQMGLNAGQPVVTGAMDVVASALGSGAISTGDVSVILGTTCVVEVVKNRKSCDFARCKKHYLRHTAEEMIIDITSTLNGMKNVDWAFKEIARTSNGGVVEGIIRETEPGSGGVIYHPYLSEIGERAPFNHYDACASFFGIRSGTTKGELLRSVYEGLAYSVRDCLEEVEGVKRILLSGGGANSELLTQIIADVTGLQIVIGNGTEFGAKGAAMTASVAVGFYEDYPDVVHRWCHIRKIVRPHRIEAYEKNYTLYRELRTAFAPLWKRRAELLGE
ncbi:MAG: FGGY-family carbohydrate kinase, partial [Eubacterium sp.]